MKLSEPTSNPRSKTDCFAVAKTLNERAKTTSKRNKLVPRELVRVAADLVRSCNEEDFDKAWISIEWINGCLNNFAKNDELGFCSKNEGYLCAIYPASETCVRGR